MNNKQKGNIYEDKACGYLESIGYRIIKRNFRAKHGEIDIIAADKDELVFIEVKFRKSNSKGLPEQAVTLQKMQTIISTAKVFMVINNIPFDTPCRFDVIAYYEESFKHYKNAFGGM